MVLIKHKKELIQVVRLLISTFILSLFANVNAQSVDSIPGPKYEVFVFDSKNNHTYLNLSSYEMNNKERYYSTYQINNLIYSKHGTDNVVLPILEGNFSINAGAVGKEWVELNKLKVKKGDSVVVKFYLKNDSEPLH